MLEEQTPQFRRKIPRSVNSKTAVEPQLAGHSLSAASICGNDSYRPLGERLEQLKVKTPHRLGVNPGEQPPFLGLWVTTGFSASVRCQKSAAAWWGVDRRIWFKTGGQSGSVAVSDGWSTGVPPDSQFGPALGNTPSSQGRLFPLSKLSSTASPVGWS